MANDTIIEELANLVEAFLEALNCTQCFTHILNLVAQCILKQFNLPKASINEALDEKVVVLAALATNIEYKEVEMEVISNDEPDDSEEGMLDPHVEMSAEQIRQLSESLHPVHLVLVKVFGNGLVE